MHTPRNPLLRARTGMREVRIEYLGSPPPSGLVMQIASSFLKFGSFSSSQPAALNVSSNRPFRDRLLSEGSSGDDKRALATNWRSCPVRRSVPNLSGSGGLPGEDRAASREFIGLA
jgi:hypothetical protein